MDGETDPVVLAQVMEPTDANVQGNVHGGVLLRLVDVAGAVAAKRRARRSVVTVTLDSMTFEAPVYVGELVLLRARVTWIGRTSIECRVRITAEDLLSGQVRSISTAYVVYVALDEHTRPVPIEPFEPRTEEERELWQGAQARRKARMERAGRASSSPSAAPT